MIAGVVLVIVVVLYRLLPLLLEVGIQQPDWLPNFSPMAALCLCAAACLPRRWALLPFGALLGTDLLLNWHYSKVAGASREFSFLSAELLGKTIAFAAIAAFGWQLRKQARARVLLPAAMGSSLFFYLVTNTTAWMSDPGYAGSLSGWAQALTTGLPQFPPTWAFYRNTFISDVMFTVLFLACYRMRPPHTETAQRTVAAW
jgi:hypothetical protein